MNGPTSKSLIDSAITATDVYLMRAKLELKKAKDSRQKNTVVTRSLESSVSKLKSAIKLLKKARSSVPQNIWRA